MNPQESNREDLPDWWDKVEAKDFDGHSNFQQLTPVQRLMWLSQIQRFVAMAKGRNFEGQEEGTKL